MTTQVRPTVEQLRAALARPRYVSIEAAPGSGKTTVASERFGVHRYAAGVDARGVLVLSFTRSAVAEAAARIRARWGFAALNRPHAVMTFDSLHKILFDVLLDQGHVTWTHDAEHRQINDSWRGASGARRLAPGKTRYVAQLVNSEVVRGSAGVPFLGVWMATAAGLKEGLQRGVCTHDDVRSVVHGALKAQELRTVLRNALLARYRAVVVDEVYDANDQDLDLLSVLCDLELPVTLIGDRWQALYGFRGARPDLVPGVLAQRTFHIFQVSKSFRYVTSELEAAMASLREGIGLKLETGTVEKCDVVLATGWDRLWKTDAQVLPLGAGQLQNKSDALLAVFLNNITSFVFGQAAQNVSEAYYTLGLSLESSAQRHIDEVLAGFRDALRDQEASPSIEQLRSLCPALGISRRPPKLRDRDAESELSRKLGTLRDRLRSHRLIPGLSVHQAKGREYNQVGLLLKNSEIKKLSRGLDPDKHEDRVLYVAATRARRSIVVLDS